MDKPACPHPHMPEPLQVPLPYGREVIVLSDGDLVTVIDERLPLPEFDYSPIRRAALAARFRALADLIEKERD